MCRCLPYITALLLGLTAHGQTYFYIHSIQVLPAEPTTQTPVTVQLIGDLSDTGAHVQVVDASVSGTMVHLTLAASSDGGFTVLVPHTETIVLGELPAGIYTIDLTDATTGVLDLAPPEQHVFTVSGPKFPCEEVTTTLRFHPFTDTALVVHVQHQTVEVFDYPNFILLGPDGDTLAFEPVQFFALAQESWHVLPLRPGVTIPEEMVDGTLQLWTGFTSTLACSWEGPFALCPPFCATALPTIINLGGGITLGTFDYQVRQESVVIATGSWTLTETEQSAMDSICLYPGHYTMEVFPQQPSTGGQPMFQIATSGWLSTGPHPVYLDVPNTMGFGFYSQCPAIINSIAEQQPPSIRAIPGPGGIWLQAEGATALGTVQVFDGRGGLLLQQQHMGTRMFVPLSSAGLYLLRTSAGTLNVVATGE